MRLRELFWQQSSEQGGGSVAGVLCRSFVRGSALLDRCRSRARHQDQARVEAARAEVLQQQQQQQEQVQQE